MNLSIEEINELLYSLGITAHRGMFCNKELNASLLDKMYGELTKKIATREGYEKIKKNGFRKCISSGA
jgi:hypothetical protein